MCRDLAKNALGPSQVVGVIEGGLMSGVDRMRNRKKEASQGRSGARGASAEAMWRVMKCVF